MTTYSFAAKTRLQRTFNFRSFHRNYLNAIKSNESSETQHEVANPMNKAMDQMYSSNDDNNGGVDIGIDGVRFFKIPHRVCVVQICLKLGSLKIFFNPSSYLFLELLAN